jgi:hypothetical protein
VLLVLVLVLVLVLLVLLVLLLVLVLVLHRSGPSLREKSQWPTAAGRASPCPYRFPAGQTLQRLRLSLSLSLFLPVGFPVAHRRWSGQFAVAPTPQTRL